MNRFFTLLLAASCLTAVGQDTTMVCGYGITSQGGGLGSWPYADIFIPSNQKAVTIYADFYRHDYSGSALDFSAAYCAGCSESDLLDWSPPYPNFFLWNYDTIPFPMYGTELLFDDISNSEVIGPGYLRILAPLTQGNDEWNDLCIGFLDLSGCVDDQACNYSEEILISNPESCDYSCCPGPGCCDIGMFWDWGLGMCQITNPSDSNFDGCVQLNDLLDLLSAYGDCGAEESPWQCGDLLEYQGYDYETVQIGEQCWFAENLRAENYRDGSAITSVIDQPDYNSLWLNTSANEEGAFNVYPQYESNGFVYNWYAVDDENGLCPDGWFVPNKSNYESLVAYAELVFADDFVSSLVDDIQGLGTNETGYSARTTGYVDGENGLIYAPTGQWQYMWYWTSTEGQFLTSGPAAWSWRINTSFGNPIAQFTTNHLKSRGLAVRCIKDAE